MTTESQDLGLTSHPKDGYCPVQYTDNEFKQMPLIQVTSGGQRSLLKKKLQVCESQQSCLFVGDQILIFHHHLQINYLKILQCDFLDFFFLFCLS